jgi:hypothetical protein
VSVAKWGKIRGYDRGTPDIMARKEMKYDNPKPRAIG